MASSRASNNAEALGFACTSGLRADMMKLSSSHPAAMFAEHEDFKRTCKDTGQLCEARGFTFSPIIAESHSGAWSPAARKLFDFITERVSSSADISPEVASLRFAQCLLIAGAATMKESDPHPAARRAFRFRPDLLKIQAKHAFKHTEAMPYGIVTLADLISRFLCGTSCHESREQLHLDEFAAHELKQVNDKMYMDLIVKQKPFREQKQGDAVNDIDPEDDRNDAPANRPRTEFLGGAGGSDGPEIEDIDGDPTVACTPVHKFNLDECRANPRRILEIERGSAPDRPKEADNQMNAFGTASGPLPDERMAPVPRHEASAKKAWNHGGARSFKGCIAKEARAKQPKDAPDTLPTGLNERDLLHLRPRNKERVDQVCANVSLDDVLAGPGHVAWKLIKAAEDADDDFAFNEEQVLVIVLMIWPLEKAFRDNLQGQRPSTATLDSLRKLPDDSGFPRTGIVGGGGCGKTTIIQKVVPGLLPENRSHCTFQQSNSRLPPVCNNYAFRSSHGALIFLSHKQL